MRLAETVTFGDDGLDRAAHLRGDDQEMARLAGDPAARGIAMWHGNPLLAGAEQPELSLLPLDHKIFLLADTPPVFLGNSPDGSIFAYDISGWQPDAHTDDPSDEIIPLSHPSELRHPDLPDDHRFVDIRAEMARLSPRDAGLAASAKAILGWHVTHGYCAKCGAKTDISMAGWQRQCPTCETRHFPRTDPVVIMLITHGNSVLLGRSPGWPEDMYSLLAGFVEPGETLETAVRREVMEEVNVRVGPVDYLASQPWPFPSSLMIGCRGEALNTEITVDPVEIEHALWISREDLMDVFSGTKAGIKPARPGSIAHFLLQNWLADSLN